MDTNSFAGFGKICQASVAFSSPTPTSQLNNGEVTVDLVDVTGQLVKQDILKKGNESLKMNVAEVASGVYFVRLTYGDKVVTQKVTVRH